MHEYEFRTLGDQESRTLFARHGNHENQVIVPGDVIRLVERGKALNNAGLTIAKSVSSPLLRCVRSNFLILEGARQNPLLRVDARLGDLSVEPVIDLAELRRTAESMGVTPDFLLLSSPSYSEQMNQRGQEGCSTLNELHWENRRRTILITSHGGARMEVTLLALINQNNDEQRRAVAQGVHPGIRMIECCEIIETIMDFRRPPKIRYLTDEDLGIAQEVGS